MSWYLVFRVLRATDLAKFPLDDQVFDLYGNHDDPTIYWVAAQSMRRFRDENISTTNGKAAILDKAYRTMLCSLIMTAAFCALYAGRVAMETRSRGGDSTVSSKPTGQSPEQGQQPSKPTAPVPSTAPPEQQPSEPAAPSTPTPNTSVPLLNPQHVTEAAPAPSTQKPDPSVPLLKPQHITEKYERPKVKR